jgi:hypothetical protein
MEANILFHNLTTKINNEESFAADFFQNMIFRCPEYDESKSCCIRMHFQRNPGSSIPLCRSYIGSTFKNAFFYRKCMKKRFLKVDPM